jgi:thiol-disulfide isomerase/thioredoxin
LENISDPDESLRMQVMMESWFYKKKVLSVCVVLLPILGMASCDNTLDKDISLMPRTVNTDDISGQQSVGESGKTMIDSSMTIGGRVGDLAPELRGITNWINSNQITMAQLKGRVVLIDFWTYSCVNCIRTIPYLKEWFERYKDQDLVIIGLHAPEFEFEKLTENVSQFTDLHGIDWPIAQDNDMKTWDSYDNMYWPAKYLIDKEGVIRYRHFGEGNYAQTEIAI